MAPLSIPGYEGLNQIGKGGFSRVYRGEQIKFKRTVAIKVLNFGLNDEADRHSFTRECELMGRVSTHPNIVTVHDTEFTTNGQPCIVMELYPGGSLADLIGEIRQLSSKEVLEVGVAIASALEASHQAGVLHCDLKPQNILISEFGQPALGDFGISTFAEERTRTGGDAGAGFTLAFAAPEIVEGESPSTQSDLYSLAATLYTGLAGRRPFFYPGPDGKKPTASEQARRILLELPAPLTDVGVPSELDQVIRGAMAKDPVERPKSAAQFAHTLHEIGLRLGFGTSTPRISHQGALPVFAPTTDFTDTAMATARPLTPLPGPQGAGEDASNSPDQRTELRATIDQEEPAAEGTSAIGATSQADDDATALAAEVDPAATVVSPAAPARSPATQSVVAVPPGSSVSSDADRRGLILTVALIVLGALVLVLGIWLLIN